MTKLEIGLWAAGSRDILQHRTLDPETRSSRIPAKLPTALAMTRDGEQYVYTRYVWWAMWRWVGDGGWGMGVEMGPLLKN